MKGTGLWLGLRLGWIYDRMWKSGWGGMLRKRRESGKKLYCESFWNLKLIALLVSRSPIISAPQLHSCSLAAPACTLPHLPLTMTIVSTLHLRTHLANPPRRRCSFEKFPREHFVPKSYKSFDVALLPHDSRLFSTLFSPQPKISKTGGMCKTDHYHSWCPSVGTSTRY